MRILFCGELSGKWRSGWQRAASLKDLGHEVIEFHHESFARRQTLANRIANKMGADPFGMELLGQYNSDLLNAIRNAKPEVAWLEWPQMLFAETLKIVKHELPACILVSFQDDNPFGMRRADSSWWRYFLEAIPEYDMHFVKRQSDVVEYKKRSAKTVELFMHGFYADLFHPVSGESIPPSFRHDVVFVGAPHDHRVEIIGDLMKDDSFPLHVYGGKWDRTLVYYRHRRNFHPHTVNEGYVQILCGSKICLGFVSSSNRDEYTMRTFEIPACRRFFLAERTPTHQSLFKEGREAEFFDSSEECADKIRFYLANESARRKIAEAGYQRCIDSDYSLQRRVADAVRTIQQAMQ